MQKESQKFYHSELMLYTPWRDEESDLLSGYNTYSEAYQFKHDQISFSKKNLEHASEEAASAIDQFVQNGPPHLAWDNITAQQQQDNQACMEEGCVASWFSGQ